MWSIDDWTEEQPMGELPVARTFEDWWALRTQYGTEDKLLARDFRHGLRHAPWPNDKDGEITGSEPQRVLPKEE